MLVRGRVRLRVRGRVRLRVRLRVGCAAPGRGRVRLRVRLTEAGEERVLLGGGGDAAPDGVTLRDDGRREVLAVLLARLRAHAHAPLAGLPTRQRLVPDGAGRDAIIKREGAGRAREGRAARAAATGARGDAREAPCVAAFGVREVRPTCEDFFRWSEPPGFSATLMPSSEVASSLLLLSSGSLGSFEPAQPILVVCTQLLGEPRA